MTTLSLLRRGLAIVAGAAIGTLAAPRAGAQAPTPARLTLAAALVRADRDAFANRAASAQVGERGAGTLVPLRGILPSLRFEAGFARTTDPTGAFGTTLRQRTIAQEDFDPARLNHPDAVSNLLGAVVVEQPLLNPDAWLGRRAAGHATDAARAAAEWTRLSTRGDVVRGYYGAVLAAAKVTTLEAALAAANEHVRQTQLAAEQGMVTASDAMLATVRAGNVEAQLIAARGDAATAGAMLGMALGANGNEAFELPATLPASAPILAFAADVLRAEQNDSRADVAAAQAAVDASDADFTRARSLLLPRVNGFARYDWNSASRLYGGERNWTVGVLASWSLFSGANEMAETRAASARRSAAGAAHDAAIAAATVDDTRTRNALVAAVAALEIAERGVEQSAGAHRIVSRKYEGGLAAISELLDAAAVETEQRLALAGAKHAVIVAAADRLRALALDPGAVRALDNTDTTGTPVPTSR